MIIIFMMMAILMVLMMILVLDMSMTMVMMLLLGGKVFFLMYIFDEWNEFVMVNLSKEAHDEILHMKAGVWKQLLRSSTPKYIISRPVSE